MASADEVKKAFDQWRQIAAEVSADPTDEGVLKLGQGLRKLARQSTYPSDERFDVQADIRATLRKIPNHANCFSKALERSIEAEIAEARDAATAVRVRPSRGEIYLTLVELPSPGIVDLLGSLLYDERDPWRDGSKRDFSRPFPNSFYAVDTLNRIGLDGVEIIELKSDRDYEAALHQWKLWYEQVKAGTRTFRFEGDPLEYNLAGPVEISGTSSRPSSYPAKSAGATASGQEPDRSSIAWLPLAAALTILGLAVIAFLRSRGFRRN